MATFLQMIKSQRASLAELKKLEVSQQDISEYDKENEILGYLINLYNSSYPDKAKVASQIANQSLPLAVFTKLQGGNTSEIFEKYNYVAKSQSISGLIMDTILKCVNENYTKYSYLDGRFVLKTFKIGNSINNVVKNVYVIGDSAMLDQIDSDKVYLPNEFGIIVRTFLINHRSLVILGNDNFDIKGIWSLMPANLNLLNSIDEVLMNFIDDDEYIACFINKQDKDMHDGVDKFISFMNASGISLSNLSNDTVFDIILSNWNNPLLSKVDFINPDILYKLVNDNYEHVLRESKKNFLNSMFN